MPQPASTTPETFPLWVTIFPGKGGLSWKHHWGPGTKEQAQIQASQFANTIAIPQTLFNHIKNLEHELVQTIRELNTLKFPNHTQ